MVRSCLVIFGIILLCSCGGSRDTATDARLFSYYTGDINSVSRVVYFPLYHGTRVGRSAERFDDGLASSFRELGHMEVIVATHMQRDHLLKHDPLEVNHMSSDDLRAIFQAFNCDAVIIGRIEQYDSYDPISIGLRCKMISCLDGAITWSAAGHFDSKRADIQDDIRDWHQATIGKNRPDLTGWQGTMQSPTLYARYVSDRLAASFLWQNQGHQDVHRPQHSRHH